MQLTEHFADTELGVDGAASQIIANAMYICQELLEPIRAQFGPVHVHDGYRPPAHNAAVGGKLTSYHLYDGTQSAADIDVLPTDYQAAFDWIRLESGLPFDKVILETNDADVPACIHLQIDSAVAPRRQAYVGKTGAGTVYTPVAVQAGGQG
jgi:hypothetical protein